MEGSTELRHEVILIAGSFGMLFLTSAITTFIYLYQRKLIKRKLAYQEIEDLLRRQELRSAYALLDGQDMERQRIAEELHDNLGSLLVTLTMYVDTSLKSEKTDFQWQFAESISKLAHQANEEVRKISHRLDSAALKHFGFRQAVKDLVQVVSDSGSVRVHCTLELNADVQTEVSINLYRILQELINNTLKHARATEIDVTITQVKTEYLSVIYEDNGVGIQSPLTQANGIGLRNIATRVEKMGGTLHIGNKGKNGFAMTLEIPL
ncbi:sensor histidine kinase [Parachryseolinea silvisoli]|jgi:two-component system, NarL family, sensor kinase|uniref:sensor histidine kinase n=1 Tax=Parachryseolinea silvisoli TaxID=2873601 RepID=UPI002265E306|nr:ATP-binding protein [Parachryseolinea silvisoli]MCD9015898.1 hypothetical protein [Parachryseolinea silvisoli]